jgi:kanamycin kinase
MFNWFTRRRAPGLRIPSLGVAVAASAAAAAGPPSSHRQVMAVRHAGAVDIPVEMMRYLPGWASEQTWESAPGALTWRMTSPAGQVRYLKTRSAGAAVPLPAEAARMRWALAAGLPVPAVVATWRDGKADWLLTEGLPGERASAPELRAEPERLVPLLASGLRRFHETPVAGCPFRFGPEEAMSDAARRVRAGLVRPEDMHPEHAHLSPAAALAEAARLRPASEPDLVVCHGDYCLPNVLIGAGEVTGFVDLGELAVADRWYDLAAATWSVTWNLGPGWEELFLTSYGVSADSQSIAFYRLIYDLAT